MTYILGRLIPLWTRVMKVKRTLRYKIFMKQATLISIIADLDALIYDKRRKLKDSIIADLSKIKQMKAIWTDEKVKSNTDNSYTILRQTIKRYLVFGVV